MSTNSKPAASKAATSEKATMATAEATKISTKTGKATIDTSSMSVEDMLALSQQLAEQAKAQSVKLFDDTMNFLVDKLKAMGRTKGDAVTALLALMSAEEKAAIGMGSSVKKSSAVKAPRVVGEYQDKDKDGHRPEIGVTYKLGNLTWVKKGKIGATKKEFKDAIQSGKTWAELKA